jgi:hypothetical protein
VTGAEKLTREHLAFLWPSLQARADVQLVQSICSELDDKRLSHLLRHHDEAAVPDREEIKQRRAFDYALQSYSLLTVALISGYVPVDVGPDPVAILKKFLDRGPVRRYYEDYYKLLLPSLLRVHLSGDALLPREQSEQAWGAFQWFVRFSGRFEKDPDLETFLSLLDGFHYGDLNIQSFLDGLKDPAAALEGIAKPPNLLTRRDSAVLGMLRFLTFCQELAPALETMQSTPLTQSACWFFYSYWFKEFADVGSHVETCLAALEHWKASTAGIGMVAAREVEKTVADTRAAITALVDGRFGAPLINRLR